MYCLHKCPGTNIKHFPTCSSHTLTPFIHQELLQLLVTHQKQCGGQHASVSDSLVVFKRTLCEREVPTIHNLYVSNVTTPMKHSFRTLQLLPTGCT